MEVFAYDPQGAETLDAFNLRLHQFANGNDVVGVVPTVIGNSLVLSLTLAEDLPMSPVLLQPFVLPILRGQLHVLESYTSTMLATIRKDNTEDTLRNPVEFRVLPGALAGTVGSATAAGDDLMGYGIFFINIGMLEFGDDK